MKMIKKTVLILVGIYLLCIPADYIRHSIQSTIDIDRDPYLQMLGSEQVTIRWQTETALSSLVRYGEDQRNLSQSHDIDASDVKEHKVTLKNLKPATQYFYQVIQNAGLSEIYSFYTAPIPGKSVLTHIWVQGDAGIFNDNAKRNYQQAMSYFEKLRQPNTPLIDLWLTTGDNAYNSGKASEYQKHLFEPYKSLLSQTSYWPAFGNHDARRYAYQFQFDTPKNGELGGIASGEHTYFSFDYADIHFIFLDSERTNFFRYHSMVQWLEDDLKATSQKWIVVLLHHPPYTKGTHDSDSWYDSSGRLVNAREVFTPILEKYNVDLVLAGHSHNYERSNLMRCHYGQSDTFKPEMHLQTGHDFIKTDETKAGYQGTVFQMIGSTSKTRDNVELNHPAMPYGFKDSGSVMLKVENNKLTSKFININGEVKDQFSITKQGHKLYNESCN